jgi:hypothetical protein
MAERVRDRQQVLKRQLRLNMELSDMTDGNNACVVFDRVVLERARSLRLDGKKLSIEDIQQQERDGTRVQVRQASDGNYVFTSSFGQVVYLAHETQFYVKWVAYEGPVVDGYRQGQGKEFYGDYFDKRAGELLYEGGFVNKWHGQGTLFRKDGTAIYTGQWEEGGRHGFGTNYDEDGTTIDYEGQWEGNQCKRGKFFHGDTLEYEGGFDGNHDFDGEGTKYHEDGTTPMYTGEWACNWRCGEGKSFRADGTLEYDGEWEENLRWGEGKSFGADGKTVEFEGEWKKGVAQRATKRARTS